MDSPLRTTQSQKGVVFVFVRRVMPVLVTSAVWTMTLTAGLTPSWAAPSRSVKRCQHSLKIYHQ